MPVRHRWLLTYADGGTRLVWAEFREVLPCGAVAFYNVRPNQPPEHVYVIAPGTWTDIVEATEPAVTAELPTLGREPHEIAKRTR
jgi:hypothetical protein